MTMGLFDRIFGRKKAAAGARGGATTSLAAALMQQGQQVDPATCGRCGTTTIASSARVWIMSVREPDMALDIGGFCPRCRKMLCPRHLSYAPQLPTHMPRPEEFKNTSYAIVCESCGVQVQAGAGGSPGGDFTLVTIDARDLEPSRPKPRKELQAPSGRFSLLKVLEGSMRDAGHHPEIPSMICTRCFGFHPHPVPAIALGIDAVRNAGMTVGPDDFEVDIGGDCPTCGVICGKHAVLRLIKMNGTDCLALHCAEHGSQLT
jgi:hypothetical protein